MRLLDNVLTFLMCVGSVLVICLFVVDALPGWLR